MCVVESFAFGTAKRPPFPDLATPRDSLNVVVYEMLDDKKGFRALTRAAQSGIL
jgi:hypothetical protein